MIPRTSPGRALARADSVWNSAQAAHQIILGATGSGKSTLVKAMLDLPSRAAERTLIIEPKRQADAVYEGPAGDPRRYGRPVASVGPRFGYEGDPGGGAAGMRYRLQGSPDRHATAQRFAAALDIVATEGHCLLVLDDVKEITRILSGTLRSSQLAAAVESILSLGRSARITAILATTEVSYVAGRGQAAITWCGFTGGSLPAAKAAADLLGWRGRERQDLCASIRRHAWIYQDREEDSAGPVLVQPAG